jgi:hypothetical protein
VEAGKSIPQNSTIQSAPVLLTAGKLSKSVFRSRNYYGTVLDNTQDFYEMKMVSGDVELVVSAVYLSEGQYEAEYVPKVIGTY